MVRVLGVCGGVLRGFCAWRARTRAAQPRGCLPARCKTRGRGDLGGCGCGLGVVVVDFGCGAGVVVVDCVWGR